MVTDESGLVKASNCQGRMEIDCQMNGQPEIEI